ncbi:MAG: hypothetical protein ACFFDT_06995 [Candidatus Hodarchaeota archaeon]
MRLPRKVNYCLLAAMVLITIIFRYPLGVEHEMGSDTTFIHTMANSISQDHQAKWILHPTSIFGLYALSYPSAAPFMLSSGYQVANISIEGMILILGLLFAIVGVLSAYLVSKQIKDDDIFAHSIALLFTLAPFYIKDTTWVASSRGFVVAVLPIVLLFLIKHMKTKDARYLILSFSMFLVMGSLHRMGLLVVFIFVAYLLAIPLHAVTQRLRFSLIRFEKPLRYALVILALIAFLTIFYIQFEFPGISGANVVEQYERGLLLTGTSFPVLLVNMAISFVGRVGLLLPLAPIGLIAYIWKRPKESTDKFFLLITFVFLPLLSLRDYIIEFVIPVFVVFVVIGAIVVTSVLKKRKKIGMILLVSLIVVSAIFSWETKDRWRNTYVTDRPISYDVYNAALYVRYETWGTVATNAGLSGGRIAAISGLPNMPLGGASMHFQSAQQLIWDYVDGENMQVRLLDLTKISFNTDEIYVPVGVRNAQFDWEVMLAYRDPIMAQNTMIMYNVYFIVTENGIFPSYSSYGYKRFSCLFGDDGYVVGDPRKICVDARNLAPDTRYVFFSNSEITLWLIRGG